MKENNQRKIFLNILDDVKICAKIINILWSYPIKYPTYCIEELYIESKMAKYGQKWPNMVKNGQTLHFRMRHLVRCVWYPIPPFSILFLHHRLYKLFWCFQSLSMLYTLLSYFQIILEKKFTKKKSKITTKLENVRAAQTY